MENEACQTVKIYAKSAHDCQKAEAKTTFALISIFEISQYVAVNKRSLLTRAIDGKKVAIVVEDCYSELTRSFFVKDDGYACKELFPRPFDRIV